MNTIQDIETKNCKPKMQADENFILKYLHILHVYQCNEEWSIVGTFSPAIGEVSMTYTCV